MNVSGVLMLNWPTTDGRKPWDRDQIAEAVRSFTPGTIDLIDGHDELWDQPAPVVGRVMALSATAEGLAFEGEVFDETLISRLQRERSLAVSAEYGDQQPWMTSQSWHVEAPHERAASDNPLLAIAVLFPDEQPARRGSALWPADGDRAVVLDAEDTRAQSGDRMVWRTWNGEALDGPHVELTRHGHWEPDDMEAPS